MYQIGELQALSWMIPRCSGTQQFCMPAGTVAGSEDSLPDAEAAGGEGDTDEGDEVAEQSTGRGVGEEVLMFDHPVDAGGRGDRVHARLRCPANRAGRSVGSCAFG